MRFGLVHRIMTDALASLGLLSLLTGGELDVTMSIVTGICMVFAVLIPERLQDHARLRSLGVVCSLSLLGLQVTRAFSGGNLLQLAVEFAAALQVIRVATRRGAAHDQQIILLALLHLVAGTVLGGGLAYGLSLVGFLVIAPGALVLSHLRREVEGNYRQGARDRTGLPVDVPRILRSRRVISRRFLMVTCSLSIPVFLFTAVLFLLFPRVGLSLLLLNHSRSSRMIGFSAKVDLGGVGKLRSDPTIAMRVSLSHPPPNPASRMALYLRGTSFDHYDGGSWSRTITAHEPVETIDRHVWFHGNPEGSRKVLTIELEPITPPVVFLPIDAAGFELLDLPETIPTRGLKITASVDGEYKYESAEERGLRYTVYQYPDSPVTGRALPPKVRARYLEVPDAIEPRIAELARKWTAGLSTPYEKVKTIERRLREEYRYDLDSSSGAAPQPLVHFLFDSRAGHCEFYSTAMAMLLRTLDIPVRNVTGFIGGTYNRFGEFYAVRQGDAHSWVEVHLNGAWRRFDPTPPSSSAPTTEVTGVVALLRDVVEAAAQRWSRHVIGYDLDQQVELFKSVRSRYRDWGGPQLGQQVRRGAPALGLLALAAAIAYAWRRLRRPQGPNSPKAANGQARATAKVVALYRALEEALRQQGIPRPASTPPLSHARALVGIGHPLGETVLELTEMYQEVRFGGRPLSSQDEAHFEAAVKSVRQHRSQRAA